MNVLVVAWCQFQARTTALAAALGAEAHYINDAPFGRSKLLTPLRYLARGAHMWRLLQRTSPRTLIVITAPVFAPMVGWLWCALHRRRLVVDCHPGALHFRRWRWARSIHRPLLRRARLALVHTPDDERLVNSWGARALFLPDDLAHENQAFRQARRANRSRGPRPGEQADDDGEQRHADPAEQRGDQDQEQQRRHGQEHVDQDAQDGVDLAAEVAAGQSDERAQAGPNERGEQANQARARDRLQDLGKDALAERGAP